MNCSSIAQRLPRASAALLGLLPIAFGAAAFAEPTVSVVPLPFEVREFRGPSSRVAAIAPSLAPLRAEASLRDKPLVVVWGEGGGAVLTLAGREVRTLDLGGSAADLATTERGRDAIPASRIEAAGPITATLTEPTREYGHEALGASVHAKSVSIAEKRPVQISSGAQAVPTEVTRVAAGPGAVFEDREPRLAKLDRDGPPGIVIVKSYAERGSALAVIGRRDGAWKVVAETPPVGEGQRWLNPAAVADFLGTGRPQIALVRTPHADGILQLWALEGDRLALKAEKAGYANHAFGRAAQDLAAAVDLDGDGRPELALPTLDRRSIALLSVKDGIRELKRIPLPAAAATGVAALGSGADTHILVGLEDGRVADIRP
ncbi:hypothetical protein [Enterovirga aerilata]|uniref:VCBS repeat-containing protein n=1 Tax=Enterovirga aerilata TaxID=2730920 RepID=A0A849IFD2_9HYPH|nr:hypothetical protein [Enterovirga sp. DB1703]NNM74840.1 hypothetical protein [Enterovirga sp. DB1703]